MQLLPGLSPHAAVAALVAAVVDGGDALWREGVVFGGITLRRPKLAGKASAGPAATGLELLTMLLSMSLSLLLS